MLLEWDEAKNETNLAKHGLGLAEAEYVFSDPYRVEWTDERRDYGEERRLVLGMVGEVLCAAYTVRGDRYRIISLRRASRQERRRYHGDS
ncbi:hypothetical protein FACS1894186_0230 [Alphaproteobacteria bacterium]|nr:hypothetical protein FACS1894186_0230 [Alphaproteobacteria bacterium]